MTQELKLVLCVEPASIRDIVVAARFKIIQCMFTNVIGISGLTVWWVFRKKNTLIHEELLGKLKNGIFTHSTSAWLYICVDSVYTKTYAHCCQYFIFVKSCMLHTAEISTHVTRKYSLKNFLLKNKSSAVLVQNRNLSTPMNVPCDLSGCYCNSRKNSTISCNNIFCNYSASILHYVEKHFFCLL